MELTASNLQKVGKMNKLQGDSCGNEGEAESEYEEVEVESISSTLSEWEIPDHMKRFRDWVRVKKVAGAVPKKKPAPEYWGKRVLAERRRRTQVIQFLPTPKRKPVVVKPTRAPLKPSSKNSWPSWEMNETEVTWTWED